MTPLQKKHLEFMRGAEQEPLIWAEWQPRGEDMRLALELALEFIERVNKDGWILGDFESEMYNTITAIKEALAQSEQEPVAYINIEERKLEWAYKYMSWDTPTVINLPKIPLYTTPPQRKPLTDGQIGDISKNYALSNPTTPLYFARAIEAAHGIKE